MIRALNLLGGLPVGDRRRKTATGDHHVVVGRPLRVPVSVHPIRTIVLAFTATVIDGTFAGRAPERVFRKGFGILVFVTEAFVLLQELPPHRLVRRRIT